MKPIRLAFLLVGLPLLSCTLAMSAPCRSGLKDAKSRPHIPSSEPLQEGQEYYVDGLLYSEFEDSGLIATPGAPRELLEELKWAAFCVQVAESCLDRIETEDERYGEQPELARIRAVVRFLGKPVTPPAPPHTQCIPGAVEVVSVVSYRPLSRSGLP